MHKLKSGKSCKLEQTYVSVPGYIFSIIHYKFVTQYKLCYPRFPWKAVFCSNNKMLAKSEWQYKTVKVKLYVIIPMIGGQIIELLDRV